MKPFSNVLPMLVCLYGSQLSAAPASKGKVIDAFNTIDPKSVKLSDLKAKVVSTPDPVHNKVLEMAIDFAKPGTWPGLKKAIAPGTLDPKKYSGIRFFYKSDTETGMSVIITSNSLTADGRGISYAAYLKGKPEWTEAVLSWDQFKSYEQKKWLNGAQKTFPGGVAILPEEYAQLSEIRLTFDINSRGNAATSVFLVDAIELVPN